MTGQQWGTAVLLSLFARVRRFSGAQIELRERWYARHGLVAGR